MNEPLPTTKRPFFSSVTTGFAMLLVTALSATFNVKAASTPIQGNLPAGFQRVEIRVDGTNREALVHLPANARTTNSPLVFVFHGHGGTARHAARGFAFDQHWPEAISVYPQGLNTPSRLVDPEGRKSGWQSRPGEQNDRDLKFFDALLRKLMSEYEVDTNQVFATGHSNGAMFTYLLWLERGDTFAAVAPSAGVVFSPGRLKPKPVMLLAGEKDTLVKFPWQKASWEALIKVNGCEPAGKPWAGHCTIYSSKAGPPVITFVHSGGHELHRDAPAMITRFFQEQSASRR